MTAFSVPANLAFDDYDSLSAFIQDWMNRNDLEGSVESMVALTEARMRRELQPLFSETSASVTASSGVAALPSDCDTVRSVFYGSLPLREVSPDAGRDYVEGDSPAAYSLEAGGIYLWPANDVTVTVLYQPKLQRLSSAAPTNTLLDEHPDLYFYGAMMFAEGYVANDPRAALFKQLWDEALDSAKRFFLRQRRTRLGYGRPQVVV